MQFNTILCRTIKLLSHRALMDYLMCVSEELSKISSCNLIGRLLRSFFLEFLTGNYSCLQCTDEKRLHKDKIIPTRI